MIYNIYMHIRSTSYIFFRNQIYAIAYFFLNLSAATIYFKFVYILTRTNMILYIIYYICILLRTNVYNKNSEIRTETLFSIFSPCITFRHIIIYIRHQLHPHFLPRLPFQDLYIFEWI